MEGEWFRRGWTRTFPGTGPGEVSEAAGQLRTGFYCQFTTAFLPFSFPPSRLVPSLCPRVLMGTGTDMDTGFGPLGASGFNDGRDKVAGPQGPSVCLETQEEAPSVGQSDPTEGCG